jgi:hypothetical protein
MQSGASMVTTSVKEVANAVLRRAHRQIKLSPRLRQERQQQRAIHHAVRELMRQYKKSHAQTERRQQGRIDFIQPVKVRFDDQRELTLLSRDLSEAGIRIIGTRSLLGQKIRVLVPRPDSDESTCFVVRILWTCSVGDGLFENGGAFLEIVLDPEPLKIVGQ